MGQTDASSLFHSLNTSSGSCSCGAIPFHGLKIGGCVGSLLVVRFVINDLCEFHEFSWKMPASIVLVLRSLFITLQFDRNSGDPGSGHEWC